MQAKYAIGIDLGTTHCVCSFAALETDAPTVEILPLPQFTAAKTIEELEALASFLYLPTAQEIEQQVYSITGNESGSHVVGELARRNSAELPERTIGAAKSWLGYDRVDRRGAILPWQAPEDVDRISPVEVSQRYLEQVVAAWSQAFPDTPIREQQVVLTVPASFDASARDLTREAALNAGLPEELILLEEPQAAVYAWLERNHDSWRKQLGVGDLLLVCDVGGGTTDLTLVSVTERDGDLELERLAVGNHLLVGGDNMDMALAFHASQQFDAKGVKLDPWQSVSLWHSCRAAKESLLGEEKAKKVPITVKKKGSRLIGGTVSVNLDRDSVQESLVDGFFPPCGIEDRPAPPTQSGFQELALPYESDPGITRHIAAFLSDQGESQQPVRPTHLLFNGGVFKADIFRQRVVDVIEGWQPETTLTPLESVNSLDNAVARGSAYYGWSKVSGAVRIRGGSPRSYYVGIQSAGLAIPGAPRPLKALCVVPHGMEEGTECDVPADEIGLVVGQQAHFRFFGSSTHHGDQPGTLLDRWDESDLIETAPLVTTLETSAELNEPFLPVRFQSRVTELGVLELWCVSTKTDDRWKLEFSIREE